MRRSHRRRHTLPLAALLGLMPFLASCAHTPAFMETGPVPADPATPVAVPQAPAPATAEHAEAKLPDNWRELAKELTLHDIVAIALANNDTTRASWFAARSAAADVGSKRAAYFPSVDLSADVSRVKQSAVGGRFVFLQTTYGPAVAINYLLFDFGNRSGQVSEAEATLMSADWQHDAAVQSVVLQVEQAYYDYLAAKAQLEAADASVKETEVSLDAAKKRHEVGVATIADVLQAKTVHSQALLQRQTIAGQIETLRGALATAMGIPANTPYDVGELPASVPVMSVSETVEPLLADALVNRPDLQAQRWQAEKASRHVGTVKAEGLPAVTLSAQANRQYYWNSQGAPYANNWSGAVQLTFPLFTGFEHSFNVKKAEADAAQSRAQASSAEQAVILDVWTAHSNLKTSAQQLATSKDVLESATESERVALGRYKEGVGSILDLLVAQAALTTARAQEIQARANWFISLAELAQATGSLAPAQPTAAPVASTTEKGGNDAQE